jgi:hypothetical protein
VLKVSAGYETIEEEFEASLRRVFVDGKADFIRLDDRRREFLVRSAGYGEEQGWLRLELIEVDEQSSYLEGRLTSAGKVHFGLAV